MGSLNLMAATMPEEVTVMAGPANESRLSRGLSRGGTLFFQAEDGIRDRHVTGVQTCALPIFGARGILGREFDILAITLGPLHGLNGPANDLVLGHVELELAVNSARGQEDVDARFGAILNRSEERRVGKECRSQW